MPTPEQVPPFHDDSSPQEALTWLEALIANTGHYSDSGILRLLSTKFKDGSLAREWYDGLEDTAKTSWTHFERHFRIRWVSTPLQERQQMAAWDKFCSHQLTYESLFAGDYHDPAQSSEIVHDWVESHAELGRAVTSRKNSELVAKTLSLLPPFLQAYLEVFRTEIYATKINLEKCCGIIKSITSEIYQYEWRRVQLSSKDSKEKLHEISEKVDNILVTLAKHRTDTEKIPSIHRHSSRTTEQNAESVAWEPCSPLTSVILVGEQSQISVSEVTTPTAEHCPFPSVAEGSVAVDEDIPPNVPSYWRKPKNYLKKEERMAIVDKALFCMLEFETVIAENEAVIMNSAIAIYDRLTNQKRRGRDPKALLPRETHPHKLLHSMELIHHYNASNHALLLHRCKEELRVRITMPGYNSGFCFLDAERYAIVHSSYKLHRSPSGKPTFAGGLAIVLGWIDSVQIGSEMTVLFMTLSSYLAELASDASCIQYAKASATCIKNHMLDPNTGLVRDCQIDGAKATILEGAYICPGLTGIFIEGLSVLAAVSGEHAWSTWAISLAETAMHLREWHTKDGILSVGSDGKMFEGNNLKYRKGLLLRGLLIAYQRNPSNKSFRDMVRSYVNVQFNALLDLSSRGSSYGVNWSGPYVGPYLHGQLAALDTLIAAVGVNE
ncbi:hypothetical protein FRC03_011622 [Tulasnella sp. 419]|nr:hypothetical protein FRC03_011622 [Tulasnella sp. 419]